VFNILIINIYERANKRANKIGYLGPWWRGVRDSFHPLAIEY
jgi:hypothetical protein